MPPTSYIKMIDVYLIFSLMIPFGTVLLQTYMDRLRLFVFLFERKFMDIKFFREDDEEKHLGNGNTFGQNGLRSINHHGKPIIVDQSGKRLGKKMDSWMSGFMNNGYSKTF